MDALVFDFDGLIVDTEWPAFVTVAEVFGAHGLELTLAQWQDRIGRGDNAPWTELLASMLGTDIDHILIDDERRARKNALTDAQPLQPGVLELLEEADRLGLATAVASSSPYGWVRHHLDRLGILDRFAVVRTRDDVVRTKPAPDLFLAACEALGVAAHRAVALEDSVHGVAAAKAARMDCVAVPNRVTSGGDFSAADLLVDSLEALELAGLLVTGPDPTHDGA